MELYYLVTIVWAYPNETRRKTYQRYRSKLKAMLRPLIVEENKQSAQQYLEIVKQT